MKVISRTLLFFSIISSTLLFAQDGNFKKTESGLEYLFHTDIKDSPKPAQGDMMFLHIIYMLNGDSLFFDSHRNDKPVPMELRAPDYPGDINEAMSMMSVGDSATFIVDAATFFKSTLRVSQLPDFLKEGDKMYFIIAMKEIKSRDEYLAEKAAEMKEKEKMKKERTEAQAGLIAAYLKDNKLTAEARPSGLYYIVTEEGDSVQATVGKTVKVHYKGTLLDGTKFDSSYDRGEPIEFPLGAGRVIKGWDEGIALMKVGEKAKLIIPFDMAYGERATGGIPAFSTLVFDVELVEVK